MGMFDYVRVTLPCRGCGEPISEWQTKDSPCTMDDVSVERIGNFYSPCPKCKLWNEYYRRYSNIPLPDPVGFVRQNFVAADHAASSAPAPSNVNPQATKGDSDNLGSVK